MAQVKVWGRRAHLAIHREALSGAIQRALVDALALPPDKQFQRFIPLDDEDFIHPPDRGEDYTIIEIAMFEGRSEEVRRSLIAALFTAIHSDVGTDPYRVEITITETPRVNWGIRGQNAADLTLNYSVQPGGASDRGAADRAELARKEATIRETHPRGASAELLAAELHLSLEAVNHVIAGGSLADL